MWEAVLIFRLIASTVSVGLPKGSRSTPAELPLDFFTGSIRLAYSAYRLSARSTPEEVSQKNDENPIL